MLAMHLAIALSGLCPPRSWHPPHISQNALTSRLASFVRRTGIQRCRSTPRLRQPQPRAGNVRDAMYAKFGRLRGQMQTLPLPDISEQIAADLESPVAKRDSKLRLRGLTVKGDINLEWDVSSHPATAWQDAGRLARELGEKAWENRANGELGIIAFLKGNTGEATKLVQQALRVFKIWGTWAVSSGTWELSPTDWSSPGMRLWGWGKWRER